MDKDQFCQLKKGDIFFYVTEKKIYTAKAQESFHKGANYIYVFLDILVDLSLKEPPTRHAAICGTIHSSEADICFASYPEANVYLQGLLVKKLERVVNNLTEFLSSQKG